MKLRFDQLLPVPREPLFAFHEDPANLAVLLEGLEGFELLEHEGHIRPGARVRVRRRIGPTSHEVLFEQFLYEPPVRFGQRQIEGPFSRFEHVHEFLAEGEGTRLVDHIELSLPWRLGGPLAERQLVQPALERFAELRRKAYERLAREGRLG